MRFTRRSKFGNRAVVVDGYRFASKREAGRYRELKLLLNVGAIANLRLQVPYVLHAQGGTKVGIYRADFVYWVGESGDEHEVVEDAKGFPTPLYQWKKRHMKAEYGIEIREV